VSYVSDAFRKWAANLPSNPPPSTHPEPAARGALFHAAIACGCESQAKDTATSEPLEDVTSFALNVIEADHIDDPIGLLLR